MFVGRRLVRDSAVLKRTKVTLPSVSYSASGIDGFITSKTMEYHYGKHHAGYVDTLNTLLKDHEDKMRAEKLNPDNLEHVIFYAVKHNSAPLFNNSAQIFNHNFYWTCLTAKSNAGGASEKDFASKVKLQSSLGSLDQLKEQFSASCVGNFGSGWTWVLQDVQTKKLQLTNTKNAETIVDANVKNGASLKSWDEYVATARLRPVLVCDVWEHAYYIDYFNRRKEYAEKFWKAVNWDQVANNTI